MGIYTLADVAGLPKVDEIIVSVIFRAGKKNICPFFLKPKIEVGGFIPILDKRGRFFRRKEMICQVL